MTAEPMFSLLYVDTLSIAQEVDINHSSFDFLPQVPCIHSGSLSVANKGALRCKSEWILLMQPGAVPSLQVAKLIHEMLVENPATDVFVPTTNNLGDGLNGLCSSGLLIRKEFLVGIAGFNETCVGYMDVEFLIRCLKMQPSRLKMYLAETLIDSSKSQFVFKAGVERVLQATRMFKRELGTAPSAWFNDYSRSVMDRVNSSNGGNISVTMAQDHLVKLASRIDYSVSHSGQADLGIYLNRSVFEGKTPFGAEGVDQVLIQSFPNRRVACRLPDTFKAFSVGNFCHSAQILKELTLRRQTGPLDWVFTNMRATTHMFENNFETFLDPKQCETARQEDKVDPHSNVAHNTFYRENFGVKFMYNHHDLNRPDHLRLFRQGAEDLLAALESEDPTMLLLVTLHRKDCEVFKPLAQNIGHRGKNNVLMIVCLDHQESEDEQSVLTIRHHPELSTYVAMLKTASRSNGMEFPLELDNTRLCRLVHGLALGCFATNKLSKS